MTEPRLDAALHRALLRARDKREQRGATSDGTVALPALEPDEALALDGLLCPRKPILPGRPFRIRLSQFEAALRGCGVDPVAAYRAVGGRPVRDLPAEQAAARATRAEFRAWLAAHEVAHSRPAVAAWLEEAADQGRIGTATWPLVERALRIVAALPAPESVQRTVLAARLLDGDPHALDLGTSLHRLTVSLLAVAAGLADETSPREIWGAWNVVVDPISSNVVALNLPLLGERRVAEMARAAHGTHLVLTYGQLAAEELQWPEAIECFSCENPSVLIAAEAALGAACPPMLCTGGRPSDAVRLLISSLHAASIRIRHHGDFDEAGVQILRDLETRYGAVPWRFDVSSLWSLLRRRAVAVPDRPPTTLEEAVSGLKCYVAEELVIEELVGDLRAAAPGLGSDSGPVVGRR
ncbi:MAG: TIGR02679 domain-containing protein [Actinomycetota bacterium]|nr:TIGR02679 domain-containing protein [Actinomycetota bacterium]